MEDGELLRRALAIIQRYREEDRSAETPVVDYVEPELLRERLELSPGAEGLPPDALLPLVESYLRYAVRTGHPQFFNQLYGGVSDEALLGDLVSSVTNTSMYTYEVAPPATLLEKELVRRMNDLVGFPDGDGIFCTGGSNANLLGLLCARDRAAPDTKTRGCRDGGRLALFVSDQAHYSFLAAANVLGIGMDQVVEVRTDAHGRMLPDALARSVRESKDEGRRPFCVGATAGTTVLGAFDPLEPIAEICREHGLWMHVDAAWGAPALFSGRRRHLLAGAERADSLTWDTHKLMGVTLTCTAFLVRRRGTIHRACGIEPSSGDYLFHDAADNDYELGRKSLQCGRRVDSVRLWLLWKRMGDRGFERQVDRLCDLARQAENRIVRDPRLELLSPVDWLNVCFRCVPTSDIDPDEFNQELRDRVRKSGRSLFNFSRLRGKVALRLNLSNPELTEADLDRFFEIVTRTAEEIEAG